METTIMGYIVPGPARKVVVSRRTVPHLTWRQGTDFGRGFHGLRVSVGGLGSWAYEAWGFGFCL